MISAKDRVPLYPGRTKMTPVSGQPNVFDMMRADQPQQEGTPLNRRTMQLLQADIRTYPVKSGESVQARDLVDVVGNQILKTLSGIEKAATSITTQSISSVTMCALDSSRIAVFYRAGNVCCRICTVTGDSISIGPETYVAAVSYMYDLKAIALSPTLAVVGVAMGGSSDNPSFEVYACSISGTSVTVGALSQALRYSNPNAYDLVKLTTTTFMVVGPHEYNNTFRAVVYSVSGTTLSSNVTNLSPGIDSYAKALSLAKLSDYSGSSRICMCFMAASNVLRAVVLLVPSSGASTVGTAVDINIGLTSASNVYIKSRGDGGYLFLVGKTVGKTEIRGKVLSITGTTVNASGLSTAIGETGAEEFHLELNSGVYALFHIATATTDVSNVVKLSRNGTTIVKQGVFVCTKGTSTYGYSSVVPVSTDKFLLGYPSSLSLFKTGTSVIANDFINGSTQAIALTSGAGGQSIDVIFDGTAELPGITAGTSITSPGVQGYSPQDGWLWVKPEWDAKQFVVGEYIGDGAASRFINIGFTPTAVILYDDRGLQGDTSTTWGGMALDGAPCRYGASSVALSVGNGGFNVYYGGNAYTNGKNDVHYYIAFR